MSRIDEMAEKLVKGLPGHEALEWARREYPSAQLSHLRRDMRRAEQRAAGKQTRTHVFLSDFHVPYHHEKAVEHVVECVGDLDPDVLVLGGDVIDCHMVSRFTDKPNAMSIREEIDLAHDVVFDPLEEAVGEECPRLFLEGNHEERIARHRHENQAFHDYQPMYVENMLDLDERGWQHKTYMDVVDIDGVQYVHGDIARKHAAYSAKGACLDLGLQRAVIGHSHKLGLWSHEATAQKWCAEAGGLFDREKADYVDNPNWQNGFVVVRSDGSFADPTLVRIDPEDGSFWCGGKKYYELGGE